MPDQTTATAYLQVNFHTAGDDLILAVRNGSAEDVAHLELWLRSVRQNQQASPTVVAVHPPADSGWTVPRFTPDRPRPVLHRDHPAFTGHEDDGDDDGIPIRVDVETAVTR